MLRKESYSVKVESSFGGTVRKAFDFIFCPVQDDDIHLYRRYVS